MHSQLYIQLENISVALGPRELFHGLSLRVHQGDRIGLVGVNGSGKTTLLRLMAGELEPGEGRIVRRCAPVYFHQFAVEEGKAASSDAEKSRLQVRHLGDRSAVSGGEETRLRLAEIFSRDGLLYLLDEPSSNLDADGIRYLNEKLRALETFILVSHDRDMLNRQCSRILELENGNITGYEGNYDDYAAQKSQARQRAMAEYIQYTEEVNRLKDVYREKKEKARKLDKKPRNISSSDAKGREFSASHRSVASKAQSMERAAANIEQRIQHMERKQKPRELPRIRPDFRLTDPPQGRMILEAENISFCYPGGVEVFHEASMQLRRGDKAVLLGPNGAGKSTLFRLIQDGEIFKKAPKARLGFFEQSLSGLDDKLTVLESVMAHSVQRETVARTILARLLFSARDMDKPVGVLSGGERNRLCFARLFVSVVNVLILDEPTNYLDLPSIEALEQMFREYEGTLLFASHDAAFVEAIANRRLKIENRKIVEL